MKQIEATMDLILESAKGEFKKKDMREQNFEALLKMPGLLRGQLMFVFLIKMRCFLRLCLL